MPKGVAQFAQARASRMHLQSSSSPDLVWVSFILDTEGANANWDYMPRKVMAKNYASAAYKPVDMEHLVEEKGSMVLSHGNPPVKNTIYGVMTEACLCWADGTPLEAEEIGNLDMEDRLDRPDDEKLCVAAFAALYLFLFPKTVAEVVQRIEQGQMAISMERWISSMDFLSVDERSNQWQACTHEAAKANGIKSRWETHQTLANAPVYRRSLAFVYGGSATTTLPANKACQFIPMDQHLSTPAKAAASTARMEILQNLARRHGELATAFVVASNDQHEAIIREHEEVTRMYGLLTGQLGEHHGGPGGTTSDDAVASQPPPAVTA
jgi:hypothetical protein